MKLDLINPRSARLLTLAVSLGFACVSVVAEAAHRTGASRAPQSRGSAEVGAAKSIIRSTLIDPASAQFEVGAPLVGVGTDGAKTVLICGTYNAKNRFGGYVGRTNFAYPASLRAVFTSTVAKLNADGSSVSLAALGNSLKGDDSFDHISDVQLQGNALTKDVEFWLHQCEG